MVWVRCTVQFLLDWEGGSPQVISGAPLLPLDNEDFLKRPAPEGLTLGAI